MFSERFTAEFRPVAERQVRRDLVIDTIAEQEKLKASESDIDDLVPIVTAYQIEWNKMHERLRDALARMGPTFPSDETFAEMLGLPTRAELDDLHATLHDLRRELRDLKRARGGGKPE